MQKSLNIIRYLILGGIFLTPFIVLIVSGFLFFPFITGKNFAFRILVDVLFGLWLILATFDKNYRPRKSWILTMAVAFACILVLSTVFSENMYRSFWSNYERMEGLVGHIHLLAYFLVVASVMNAKKLWDWFFHVSLFVSVIISFYGVSQMYCGGLAFGQIEASQPSIVQTLDGGQRVESSFCYNKKGGKNFAIHQSSDRLDATLGNASYLAIYMVFHIFLALMYFLKTKKAYRWLYLLLVIVQTVVLYNTATRGSILGMIGGVMLMTFLLSLFSPSRKIKMSATGALLVVLLLVGSFFSLRTSDFVQQNSVLSRFANISWEDTTTQSRFIIWGMSWGGFKEKPLLGWGLENYNLVFNKYYQPNLWPQEPWFDRAHNVFFDRLTTNGLFGLLFYLGLFLSPIYYLWVKRKEINFSIYTSTAMTAMFAAYFFHNLFVFDNLISSALFFTFLGYVHFSVVDKGDVNIDVSDGKGIAYALTLFSSVGLFCLAYLPIGLAIANKAFLLASSFVLAIIFIGLSVYLPFNKSKSVNVDTSNLGAKSAYAIIIGLVTIFILYSVNVPGLLAARSLISTFGAWQGGDVEMAYQGFKNTIAYGSFGTIEAREHLVKFAGEVVQQPVERIDSETKNEIFMFAVEEMKKQVDFMNGDIRAMIFLASLYNKGGQYDQAVEVLDRAIALSPKKQLLYFESANAHLGKQDYDKALESFKIAFELDTNYSLARENYAMAAIFAGKDFLAEDLMADYGGIIVANQKFLTAFASRGQYSKVSAIWEMVIAEEPGNLQARVSLAKSYLEAGERGKAIGVLQKVIELEPKFKQEGEFLINEIRAGRNP